MYFVTLLFSNIVWIFYTSEKLLKSTLHRKSVIRFLFHDFRFGFEDVVQYLSETHKVSVDLCDTGNKTMIFHAVTSSQPTVLRYLLSLVSYAPDDRCQETFLF